MVAFAVKKQNSINKESTNESENLFVEGNEEFFLGSLILRKMVMGTVSLPK